MTIDTTSGDYLAELQERMLELEWQFENRGWVPYGDQTGNIIPPRNFIHEVNQLARMMFLKNPLIRRGVIVAADYIFGRKVEISAKDDTINAVIQAFLNDENNQSEFSSQEARLATDRELRLDGNWFFVFFVHPETGKVRISSIPDSEIIDKITDPNNRKRTLYYKRVWQQPTFNPKTGQTKAKQVTRWYRDWRNQDTVLDVIGKQPVDNAPVYHVKTGAFSDWPFGISEVFSAVDWAKAYKNFLEDWATIVKAYARYAWRMKTTGGAKGVQAAKAKLGTSVGIASSSSGPIDRNPPATAGATFIGTEDVGMEPIRTSGATTSADDGRRMLLMVAAAQGLPETFYGDVSVGTLATAESLDRPTTLAFTNRQTLWADIYNDILAFVIYNAVAAPTGPLQSIAHIEANEYDEDVLVFDNDIDPTINVVFPDILEQSMTSRVAAIKQAATLDGQVPLLFANDMRSLAVLLLNAIGAPNANDLAETLFPETTETQPVESLREAVIKLRDVLEKNDVPATT
jgi:hypothetical protein